MSGKELFPLLSGFLAKGIGMQKMGMEEDEEEMIKLKTDESHAFFVKMIGCRNKDNSKNVTCLVEVIGETRCKSDYEELLSCIKHLGSHKIRKEDKVKAFCYKQDYNVRNCLEELIHPAVRAISELPTRN
jgi:hypothetical protein